MTTVYTQGRFKSIFIGATGHVHNREGDFESDETPMAVDCVSCEPYLVKEGWVYAPEQVPLTDRQEREQQRQEREGNMAVKQVAEALAESAREALATGSAPRRRAASKKSVASPG